MCTCGDYQDRVIDACNECDDRNVYPGLSWTCDDCKSSHGIDDEAEFERMIMDEGYSDGGGFSWHDCDLCGSRLGGDRYAAHGQYKGEWYHLDICVDCLQYTANGTLPKCACEDNGGRN
jgi:hypothetical protein